MKIPGSRLDFEESWLQLYEMPMGIPDMNIYGTLVYALKERIEYGAKIIKCKNNLYKVDSGSIVYYWIGKDIDIIAELSKTAQNLTINAVAKKTSGQAPYATDLYIEILDDTTNNLSPALRFQSDTKLTKSGLKIWKRLIDKGYAITVYDNRNPGQSMKTLHSADQLLDFFKDYDNNYQRYQFVLSKQGNILGEVRGFFNTRRMRELTGNL